MEEKEGEGDETDPWALCSPWSGVVCKELLVVVALLYAAFKSIRRSRSRLTLELLQLHEGAGSP